MDIQGCHGRRYESILCSGSRKEKDGERARALPLGEHVPGLPGRNLFGDGSSVSAHRRQPRGPTAAPEAHRGQGGGRALAHLGRLLEGPPALRRQRGRGARAVAALLGELIAVVALATACDQGHQADQARTSGAGVRLIAQNVSTTQPLPPDGHIELAFDRLLMPSITIRQTFILADVRGNLLTPGVVYDPVARVVTITPMAPLDAGQRYQLAITSPKDPSDPNGLRAIDGALLDPSSASLIEFVASASDSGTSAGGALTPPIAFSNDVLPPFVTNSSS